MIGRLVKWLRLGLARHRLAFPGSPTVGRIWLDSRLRFDELANVDATNEPQLAPYDLASRLSYALWAAPPDEPLLASAASKKLTAPAELKKQATRMLADERAAGFVNAFLDSWLSLRDLGSQPPAREAARVYYAENLPEAMKMEV